MKFGDFFFILCFFHSAELVLGKLRSNVPRIYVTEGGSFELSCKAEPKLIKSYRWVYVRERQANDSSKREPRVLSSGNRLMVGEPRFTITTRPQNGRIAITLKFEDIQINESGYFMCWRQGLKPDPRVFVKVLQKGSATAQPTSVDIQGPSHIRFGAQVTIRCYIRPYLPGSVTWFRNGQVILAENLLYSQYLEEREKEFVSSLKIATARESVNYTCMVPSNPPLEKTYELIVTVGKVEELSLSPDENSVQYGMTLTLTCVASGTDSDIVWLKDGSQLNFGESRDRFSKESMKLLNGKWRSILRIPSFSISDNGHYVCYVPGDSRNALVNIEGRPPQVLQVTGEDFRENDVIQLTCDTQYARNEKEVTWLFNDEPLNHEWWLEENKQVGHHNISHHYLNVLSPTSQHAGTYTCYSTFGAASTTVRQIVPPYVVEGPHEPQVMAVEGEPLSLVCSVAGYPPPVVIWEKWINNKWKIIEEAQTEHELEVEGVGITKTELKEGADVIGERRALLFDIVEPYHAGKYQCIGYIDKDAISVLTEIIVQDPNPSIVKLSAQEVTEGENMTIACSVANWDAPVEFTSYLRVLSPEVNSRYLIEFQGYGMPYFENEDEKAMVAMATRGEVATYALIISDVKLEDQGVYECQAGPDVSQAVSVKVKQRPPEIIEMAASPAVEASEFYVSCTVKYILNAEKASFMFNGRALDEFQDEKRYSLHLAERMEDPAPVEGGRAKQATYVLKINNVVLEDSGEYHCVVRPGINESVYVEVAPRETVKEIVNMEAYPAWIGGALLLKCTVQNWEGEVTFYQNTSLPIEEDDSRFKIEKEVYGNTTVHSLIVNDVSKDDAGYYQCFTTPHAFAGANITIREKDSLRVNYEQNPPETPVELNSFLNMHCAIEGIPQSLNYTVEILHDGVVYAQWSSSEEEQKTLNERVTFHLVQDSGSTLTESEQDGDESDSDVDSSLVLDRVSFGDSGRWDCLITFEETGYSRSASIAIDVYDPLKFIDVPEEYIDVKMGSNVTLSCSTSGYPLAEVFWVKEPDNDIILEEGTEIAELPLMFFSPEEEGVYTCIATNKNENLTSTTELRIIHELEIIESPEPIIFVSEDDSVQLKCVAFGTESPHVEWIKDGQVDEPITVGTEVAILYIADFKEEDAGGYTCRASIGDFEKLASTELLFTRKADTETTPTITTPGPTLHSGRLLHLTGPPLIEENSKLVLTCLVSPLLDAYRALIVVNNSMIAIDDHLIAMEPRVSLQVSQGGNGERMLKVSIEPITKADSGVYECRANTEILTRHSVSIQVVGEGELTTATMVLTTTQAPSSSPLPVSEIDLETGGTTSTESSTLYSIFMSSTSSQQSTTTTSSPATTFTTTLSSIATSAAMPEESSSSPDLMPPYTVPAVFLEDYYEDLAATIVEDPDIYKDVVIGDSVVMSCTVYAETDIPIMWKRKSIDSLLFVDYIKLTNDEHFSLEIFDGNNTFSRNLQISNISRDDEDDYLCYVQSVPPVNTTVHLQVFESDNLPVAEDTDYGVEVTMDKGGGVTELSQEEMEDEIDRDGEGEELQDYDEMDYLDRSESQEEYDVIEEGDIYTDATTEKAQTDDVIETEEEEIIDEIEIELKEKEGVTRKYNKTEEDMDSEEESEEDTEFLIDYEDLINIMDSMNTTTVHPTTQEDIETMSPTTHPTEGAQVNWTLTGHTFDNHTSTTVTPLMTHHTQPPMTSSSIGPISSSEDTTSSPQTTTGDDLLEVSSTEEPLSTTTESDQTSTSIQEIDYDYTFGPSKEYDYYSEFDVTSTVAPTTTTTTTAKPKEYPVIVATPGEDVIAHSLSEVHLNCPTTESPEDITWKGDDKLLFLGSLDLAGVEGVQLTDEGTLILLPGYSDIKNGVSYACLVYDYKTYEDVHLVTYDVFLEGEAAMPKKESTTVPSTSITAPFDPLEFSGLEFESIAVLSNNHLAGKSLAQVLQEGGLNANLVEKICNGNSSSIEGWQQSHSAVEDCEMKAKKAGSVKEGQPVFIIVDFLVRLPPNNLYGSTLIYVNNVSRKIKAHVFGPLVPLPSDRTSSEVECGNPIYENQDNGLDLEEICKSAVSSSIMTLQEAYLSQAKKSPLF